MADEDTRTITVKVVNTQKSTTTGTPAAGIGTGEKFQAESADESPSDFGQIEFAASDVGAGTEDTYFQILLRIAGAALSAAYRFVAMTAFRAIFTHANSADRTYTLPNKTGSVAMLDDIFLLSGLAGLGLSNNGVDATNDIDIAVGAAISNDAVLANRVAMSLTSALTKQLDAAWAVGNNAGMRDTGAISDATWHIFLIKRTDTGVVDVLASLSFSSPTMPTNYDKKKWIGAIIRTAAAIKAFSHYQDEFLWKATVLDINAIDPGTAAVTRTLTVPTGLKVQALMNIGVQIGAASSSSSAYISSLDINDEAPSITVAPMAQVRNVTVSTVSQARIVCRTDTSAQVRSRISASDGGIVLYGATLGWRVDRAEV
jgi:hypothetical protein